MNMNHAFSFLFMDLLSQETHDKVSWLCHHCSCNYKVQDILSTSITKIWISTSYWKLCNQFSSPAVYMTLQLVPNLLLKQVVVSILVVLLCSTHRLLVLTCAFLIVQLSNISWNSFQSNSQSLFWCFYKQASWMDYTWSSYPKTHGALCMTHTSPREWWSEECCFTPAI